MSLNEGIQESAAGTFSLFTFEHEVLLNLQRLWGPEPEEEPAVASWSLEIDVQYDLAEPKPLSWSIAFTPSFRKAVSAIDRKLQGRVLAAITDLSERPTVAYGDTRKPLSGELKGYWRYRLGDYRLVYEPREEKQMVVLIDFAARGGTYE